MLILITVIVTAFYSLVRGYCLGRPTSVMFTTLLPWGSSRTKNKDRPSSLQHNQADSSVAGNGKKRTTVTVLFFFKRSRTFCQFWYWFARQSQTVNQYCKGTPACYPQDMPRDTRNIEQKMQAWQISWGLVERFQLARDRPATDNVLHYLSEN